MIVDEYILIKYIEGTLPDDERAQVDDWVAASPENAKLLEQVYFTLQVTDRVRVMESVDPEMALVRFKSKVRKQNKKVSLHRSLQMLQRVAAVLFIPVLVLSAYLFMQIGQEEVRMVEVRTNPGVVSTFDLPDGSKVWLNAGSSLKYPKNFWPECRQVELTGQGYFEVAKNPEKPFIVKVDPSYSVEVLGTRFDVSAYKDDEFVSTTLVEGSVQLNIAQAGGHVQQRALAEACALLGQRHLLAHVGKGHQRLSAQIAEQHAGFLGFIQRPEHLAYIIVRHEGQAFFLAHVRQGVRGQTLADLGKFQHAKGAVLFHRGPSFREMVGVPTIPRRAPSGPAWFQRRRGRRERRIAAPHRCA